MMKHIALISGFLLLLTGCTPKTTEQANEGSTPQGTAPASIDEAPVLPAGFTVRAPADEELNEFGIITGLEEAGYPLYNVTVSFPERGTSSNFLLNAEKASLSHEVNAFAEKYATIYYESETSNEVLDIIFEGKSLSGAYEPGDHEGLESFTGVLRGASSASGDLPTKLAVEGEDGALPFEYFVDAATMTANDQAVTIYYYTRYLDAITYLELSAD